MKHLIWIIVFATLSCKVVHYYPIEIRKIPLKYYMDSDPTDEEWIRRKYIPSEEYPVALNLLPKTFGACSIIQIPL